MKNRKFKLCAAFLVVCVSVSQSHGEKAERPVDLLRDAQISFSLVRAGQAGPWEKDVTVSEKGKYDLNVRYTFQASDPIAYLWLTLRKHEAVTDWVLNGQPVPVPIQGMQYRTVPGVSARLLRGGKNVLDACWSFRVKDKAIRISRDAKIAGAELLALTGRDLAFQTGPILGYAGTDFFTVTCRTTMPARVTLLVNDKAVQTSPTGLMHRLRAKALKAGTEYRYRLAARIPGQTAVVKTAPFTVKTYPQTPKLVFAIFGDCRTNGEKWAAVADALAKQKPMFAVIAGDYVTAGRRDWEWDQHFWANAKTLLAAVPIYAVIGNHGQYAPVFYRLFAIVNNDIIHWSQRIGPLLVIGIDTNQEKWHPGETRYAWLESVLASSDAPFVVLINHSPGWTSGPHGRIAENGQPAERAVRYAKNYAIPLLAKYKAQVVLSGDDHMYERSELDNGVTMIISGGAGAPLYEKVKHAVHQNPYSKVFAKDWHYCLFTIDGQTMRMQAKTPAGKIIDTRQWQARKP